MGTIKEISKQEKKHSENEVYQVAQAYADRLHSSSLKACLDNGIVGIDAQDGVETLSGTFKSYYPNKRFLETLWLNFNIYSESDPWRFVLNGSRVKLPNGTQISSSALGALATITELSIPLDMLSHAGQLNALSPPFQIAKQCGENKYHLRNPEFGEFKVVPLPKDASPELILAYITVAYGQGDFNRAVRVNSDYGDRNFIVGGHPISLEELTNSLRKTNCELESSYQIQQAINRSCNTILPRFARTTWDFRGPEEEPKEISVRQDVWKIPNIEKIGEITREFVLTLFGHPNLVTIDTFLNSKIKGANNSVIKGSHLLDQLFILRQALEHGLSPTDYHAIYSTFHPDTCNKRELLKFSLLLSFPESVGVGSSATNFEKGECLKRSLEAWISAEITAGRLVTFNRFSEAIFDTGEERIFGKDLEILTLDSGRTPLKGPDAYIFLLKKVSGLLLAGDFCESLNKSSLSDAPVLQTLTDLRFNLPVDQLITALQGVFLEYIDNFCDGSFSRFRLTRDSEARPSYGCNVSLRKLFDFYAEQLHPELGKDDQRKHARQLLENAYVLKRTTHDNPTGILQRLAEAIASPVTPLPILPENGLKVTPWTSPETSVSTIPLGTINGRPLVIILPWKDSTAVKIKIINVAGRKVISIAAPNKTQALYRLFEEGGTLMPYDEEAEALSKIRASLEEWVSGVGKEELLQLSRMYSRELTDILWAVCSEGLEEIFDKKRFQEIAQGEIVGDLLRDIFEEQKNSDVILPPTGSSGEDIEITSYIPSRNTTGEIEPPDPRENIIPVESVDSPYEPDVRDDSIRDISVEALPRATPIGLTLRSNGILVRPSLKASESIRDTQANLARVANLIEGQVANRLERESTRKITRERGSLLLARMALESILKADPIGAVTVESLKYLPQKVNEAFPESKNQIIVEARKKVSSLLNEMGAFIHKIEDRGVLAEGKHLSLYQVIGVKSIVERPRLLFADDMGLGKTVQAITGALMSGSRKILVIAPRPERWVDDLDKLIGIPLSVHLISSTRVLPLRQGSPHTLSLNTDRQAQFDGAIAALEEDTDKVQVVLSTFQSAPRFIKDYVGNLDCLIIDEAHLAKNNETNIYAALLEPDNHRPLTERTERVILLTGTPIENSPKDLEAHFRLIAKDGSKNIDLINEATKKASGGSIRNENADELARLSGVISQVIVRRKADLLKGFYPEKRVYNVELDPQSYMMKIVDAETRRTVETRKLAGRYSEQFELYEQVRREPETFATKYLPFASGISGNTRIMRMEQVAAGPSILGLAGDSIKIDAACDITLDAVTRSRGVVIFSFYRESVAQVVKALKERHIGLRVEEITGDVTDSTQELHRSNILKVFEEGSIDVLVCTAQTLGISVELRRAKTQIHVDYPWKHSDLDQSYGRSTRRSRTPEDNIDPIEIYHLRFDVPYSVDKAKYKLIEGKRVLADLLIDNSSSSKTQGLLKALNNDSTMSHLMGERDELADVLPGLSSAQRLRLAVVRIYQAEKRGASEKEIIRMWNDLSVLYEASIEHKASFFLNCALLKVAVERGWIVGPEVKALDVASGPSVLSRAAYQVRDSLQSRGVDRFTVTDLDASEAMLKLGTTPATHQHIGSFSELGTLFKRSQFDVVNLSFCFGYVPSPAQALRDANKVLKDGGVLTILLPTCQRLDDAFLDGVRRSGFEVLIESNERLLSRLRASDRKTLAQAYGKYVAADVARITNNQATILVARKIGVPDVSINDSDLVIQRTFPMLSRAKLITRAKGPGKSLEIPMSVEVDGIVKSLQLIREVPVSEAVKRAMVAKKYASQLLLAIRDVPTKSNRDSKGYSAVLERAEIRFVRLNKFLKEMVKKDLSLTSSGLRAVEKVQETIDKRFKKSLFTKSRKELESLKRKINICES